MEYRRSGIMLQTFRDVRKCTCLGKFPNLNEAGADCPLLGDYIVYKQTPLGLHNLTTFVRAHVSFRELRKPPMTSGQDVNRSFAAEHFWHATGRISLLRLRSGLDTQEKTDPFRLAGFKRHLPFSRRSLQTKKQSHLKSIRIFVVCKQCIYIFVYKTSPFLHT